MRARRVVLDVVAHHGASVTEGGAGWTAAFGQPGVGRNAHTAQVIVPVPALRGRHQQRGGRVVPADPSHAEPPVLDQHLADFLEKLRTAVRPDDGLVDLAQRRLEPLRALQFPLVELQAVIA